MSSTGMDRGFFHFTYAHDSIVMFDPPGTNARTIDLSQAPGINDAIVYFPRWSNDARFLTMMGPWIDESRHLSELHMGRFNGAFTEIAEWIQVTHDSQTDCWGDAWIADGEPELAVQPVSLNLNVMMGENPATQSVSVFNSGSSVLDGVTVTLAPPDASDWLQVNPRGSGNNQSLDNVFEASTLAPGTHEATVQVSRANASNPQTAYTVSSVGRLLLDDTRRRVDRDCGVDQGLLRRVSHTLRAV